MMFNLNFRTNWSRRKTRHKLSFEFIEFAYVDISAIVVERKISFQHQHPRTSISFNIGFASVTHQPMMLCQKLLLVMKSISLMWVYRPLSFSCSNRRQKKKSSYMKSSLKVVNLSSHYSFAFQASMADPLHF